MKIAAFVHERSACTYIRVRTPAEKIGVFNLAEISIIGKGDPETDRILKGTDVVFLGRAGGRDIISMVKSLNAYGKKVVYDLDDNMFGISPLSPHYKDFGIMPVEYDGYGDAKGDLWKDGEGGFNVARNRQMRKAFIEIIREVNCVTVTTEPLAKIYRRMNDNVRVIPNAIDFGVWEKPRIRYDGDETRLLYTGAANHQEDWMFVSPVLAELQEEHPNLKIVLVGTDWKTLRSGINYKRVEVHPWVDIESYPYLLQTLCCDIGIAPISKIDFNDCRSSIKWLEYSALKMATVATNYGPYKRDMQDGVTGLLVEERVEWKAALSRLIKDKEYRNLLAAQAFKHCKATYDIDYVVDDWIEAFKSAMGRD